MSDLLHLLFFFFLLLLGRQEPLPSSYVLVGPGPSALPFHNCAFICFQDRADPRLLFTTTKLTKPSCCSAACVSVYEESKQYCDEKCQKRARAGEVVIVTIVLVVALISGKWPDRTRRPNHLSIPTLRHPG